MNCTIRNCTNKVFCKGWCSKHYSRWQRHGNPEHDHTLTYDKNKPCKIPGCNSPVWAKTMCGKHYRRWERTGDPLFINPKCNRDPGHEWTKERAYANTAKWKQKNKKVYNAYLSSVKKHVKLATPKWLDNKLLQEVHKNCPDGYQVDHIIPIQNEFVSGLNVPWNLQYLTAFENNSKNNKFDGTYENETWRLKFDKASSE